ncbi:MAG TPA: FecR domain-containing protein [Gemmatimonadaceae bacterium]|jgi:ferric-dicitrate binding protein FerR (iron transport regulator)
MSTSDTRTESPSPLTGSGVLTDEASLKRAFDDEFAQCLTSAKSQLGEAVTLAPRVVENAFVALWMQRMNVNSREQMRTMLADEVRHGSARALSKRHSGARFGAVGGAQGKSHASSADAESPPHIWAQIEKDLHGASADARAATAAAGRHEAASHMKDMSKKTNWVVPVLIGVFALVISVGGVMYFDRLGEDDVQLALVANQSIQPITSTAGQIGTTKLPDGSAMTIGPETKIFMPETFGQKSRVVKVVGTATFEVAKGQQLPFRVVVNRNHIIATGTKFTVSTFNPDSLAMVMVEEGTVTLKAGKNTAVANAGQAMLLDATKGIRPLTEDEKAEAFGWVDKRVTVRNKQLRYVVAQMGRWFNYDIKVPDTQLLERMATIDVPLDSSKLAITQVEESAKVKFAYEGESKVFRDAPVTPAPGTKPAAKAAKKK